MYVVVDEDLQILGRIDMLHLQRRNDHMFDASRIHPVEQLFVQFAYAQACQIIAGALVLVADKSHRAIRRTLRRTKHLGDCYTGGLRAVNHHPRTARTALYHFVDRLHAHTQDEQQHERYRHVEQYNGVQYRMVTCRIVHRQVDQQQHNARTECGQQDLDHVYERGIAQNARIGVECPEREQLNPHYDAVLQT